MGQGATESPPRFRLGYDAESEYCGTVVANMFTMAVAFPYPVAFGDTQTSTWGLLRPGPLRDPRSYKLDGRMLIAAISDTHIPDKARALPEALVERLRTVDLILHAGDITSSSTLDYLKRLAPTEAVHGNVDDPFLKATLPDARVVEAGGFRIGLIHGNVGSGGNTMERARRAFTDVDCVIFGHSHSPYLERHGSVLLLNPGSPTDRRRAPRPSFALLSTDQELAAELVYL